MTQDERRRGARVAKPFMLRYRPRGDVKAQWLTAPLKDLSRSGALFLSAQNFRAGTVLEVKLLLPTITEPVEFPARVVRVKDAPLGLYEHAIAFTPTSRSVGDGIEDSVRIALKRQREAR